MPIQAIGYYNVRRLDMEKPNIKWYEDDELTIGFSEAPHVCVRYVLPSSTPAEVKSIKKYPFIIALHEADLEATYLVEKEE